MACGNTEVSRDGLVSQPTEPPRPSGRLDLGFANQNPAEVQATAVARADQQVSSAQYALRVAATPAAMTSAVKAAEKAIADARRARVSREQVQRLEAALRSLKAGLNEKLLEAEELDRRRAQDAAIQGNRAMAAVMDRRTALSEATRLATTRALDLDELETRDADGPEGSVSDPEVVESAMSAAIATSAGIAFYTREDIDFQTAASHVPSYGNEYVVDIHGNSTSAAVQLVPGDPNAWLTLSAVDLASAIRKSPWRGEPIRLFSCSTGSDENGFAQQLANELNVVVTAPTTPVWTLGPEKVIVTEAKLQMLSDGRVIRVPTRPPTGRWREFDPK